MHTHTAVSCDVVGRLAKLPRVATRILLVIDQEPKGVWELGIISAGHCVFLPLFNWVL